MKFMYLWSLRGPSKQIKIYMLDKSVDVLPFNLHSQKVCNLIFLRVCLFHSDVSPANFSSIFSVCAPLPSFVGAYYLQYPDARAIFLHNDLPCNGTRSVTAGRIS